MGDYIIVFLAGAGAWALFPMPTRHWAWLVLRVYAVFIAVGVVGSRLAR
jgi:hypothetical protein